MKKYFFILTALLINFSLFAAPPGGRDKPDKGGPLEGRDHGGISKGDKPDRSPPGRNPSSDKPGPAKKHNSSDRTINFRGQRITLSDKKPEVLKATAREKTEGGIRITIYFNQSIKPASLAAENIFVDNSRLEKDVKLVFNKRSDNVYFDLAAPFAEIIEIQNLEGLNGKKIESIKVLL